MKKIILFVGMLFLLSFLVGCGQKDVDEYYISNEEFFRGTDGFAMEFRRGVVPDSLLDDTLFSAVLQLHNKGAYYLNGFITLIFEKDFICIADDSGACVEYNVQQVSGTHLKDQITQKQQRIVALYKMIDEVHAGRQSGDASALAAEARGLRDDIQVLKKSVPLTNPFKTKWIGLEGKSFFTPGGEQDEVRYTLKTKPLPSLKTKHTTQLIATSCYEYATSFTDEVCIDTNVNKLKIFEGTCEAEDVTSSGQGSPVLIERVEVTMLQDTADYVRPQFNIHVRNAGKGKVINAEKVEEACSSAGLEKRDYNAVFLNTFMLSNAAYSYTFDGYDPATGREVVSSYDQDTVECYPNPLILRKGEDNYFRCAVQRGLSDEAFRTSQASYKTPVQIDLSYGYQFSQSVSLDVEKDVVY